ncbi:DUF4870 domain-containing protein [Neobacillus sp. NRS-1170]|uniref:DUF4870 domain-containing protein n=1 Tax=Neobacillus sp. NRS-1170 TaxID=3233898 RepID=UPI003D27A381
MDSRKVLSCLSYFSIFFAGFLFPLVVLIASGDQVTKMHAKKALLSHLIPLIPTPIVLFSVVYEVGKGVGDVPVLTIISIVILVILWVSVLIWNVVKGVKVLITE